jgi:hypothetical protein
MVCLRNICINTLHKGDDDNDDNNNNNNNVDLWSIFIRSTSFQNAVISIKRQEGKADLVHAIQSQGQ